MLIEKFTVSNVTLVRANEKAYSQLPGLRFSSLKKLQMSPRHFAKDMDRKGRKPMFYPNGDIKLPQAVKYDALGVGNITHALIGNEFPGEIAETVKKFRATDYVRWRDMIIGQWNFQKSAEKTAYKELVKENPDCTFHRDGIVEEAMTKTDTWIANMGNPWWHDIRPYNEYEMCAMFTVTLISQDGTEIPIRMKSRVDWWGATFYEEHGQKVAVVSTIDWKTCTTSNPAGFRRQIFARQYDLQSWLYSEALVAYIREQHPEVQSIYINPSIMGLEKTGLCIVQEYWLDKIQEESKEKLVNLFQKLVDFEAIKDSLTRGNEYGGGSPIGLTPWQNEIEIETDDETETE